MLIELRLAACAAMLVVAAIIDIKKREIPDKIWLGFGGLGVVLATLEFSNSSTSSSLMFKYILGIGIVCPIAYSVYKTGLFGGADSKALIAIAILFPWFNEWALFKLHGFTALTVLSNALLVSMLQLAFNATRNLIALAQGRSIFEGIDESAGRKVLALATGYRTNSLSGYLFPMETIDKSGRRKFVFNPARYEEFVVEQDVCDPIFTYSKSQEKGMWVTQALPFILYLAVGFALTVTVGDLLGAIIQNVQLPL
jgi:archaeal preflagellin peptidase FlaK